MTKKEMIKSGIKLVVSFGVGAIVTNAVSFTTPVYGIGTLKRLAIGVGSFAMSMYTSDKITEYVDQKVDECFNEFEKMMCDKDCAEKKVMV